MCVASPTRLNLDQSKLLFLCASMRVNECALQVQLGQTLTNQDSCSRVAMRVSTIVFGFYMQKAWAWNAGSTLNQVNLWSKLSGSHGATQVFSLYEQNTQIDAHCMLNQVELCSNRLGIGSDDWMEPLLFLGSAPLGVGGRNVLVNSKEKQEAPSCLFIVNTISKTKNKNIL